MGEQSRLHDIPGYRAILRERLVRAEQQRRERRDVRRRRWTKLAAVGVAGGIVLGFGGAHVFTGNRDPAPTSLEQLEDTWNRKMERIAASGGPPAVDASLVLMDDQEVLKTFIWIAGAHREDLYPCVFALADDEREPVRRAALVTVLQIEPAALGPHLETLQAVRDKVRDEKLRGIWDRALQRIREAARDR